MMRFSRTPRPPHRVQDTNSPASRRSARVMQISDISLGRKRQTVHRGNLRPQRDARSNASDAQESHHVRGRLLTTAATEGALHHTKPLNLAFELRQREIAKSERLTSARDHRFGRSGSRFGAQEKLEVGEQTPWRT